MSEYNDENRGVAFPPFPDQTMILNGKLNIDGTDSRIALVKSKTASGKQIVEVYQKIGVLFAAEDGNEKAPDYSGPIDVALGTQPMRLAGWKKMKDGKPYMSLSVSEARTKSVDHAAHSIANDSIPF